MSRRSPRPKLSEWQKLAQKQLRALADAHPDTVEALLPGQLIGGHLVVRVRLATGSLTRTDGGLVLQQREEFLLFIGEDNNVPPQVAVEHSRFLNFPHVLAGTTLCLYLDPSREWRPSLGMYGLLERLWDWLDDAAAGRFDADTALYHAAGGVPHETAGTPTTVVRHTAGAGSQPIPGYLTFRTGSRFDHHVGQGSAGQLRAPVFMLPYNLPFGAGQEHLVELLRRLDWSDGLRASAVLHQRPKVVVRPRVRAAYALGEGGACDGSAWRRQGFELVATPTSPGPMTTSQRLLTVLVASALRQDDGTAQHVVLGVPHPAGGAPHLLGLRLPPAVADALRRFARVNGVVGLDLDSRDVLPTVPMEWCRVSDERPEVTTRRDGTRPANAVLGKTVVVWGCGGLGSWVAEFVVRAGAARVILLDPGVITGGLLVRQNYTEADVGDVKDQALASRLRSLRDDVQVDGGYQTEWGEVDLVIDATVSLGVGEVTDKWAAQPERPFAIARLATDTRTGNLGLAVISTVGDVTPLGVLDAAAGEVVRQTAELEDYRAFWSDALAGDELTPTRGCSAPTFHGSAADMAAIAGVLFNSVCSSLAAGITGIHLLALPTSGVVPAHRFIPADLGAAGANLVSDAKVPSQRENEDLSGAERAGMPS